jgi:peptide chain release factor 3
VGQLQFEVIQFRLEHEYGAKCRFEPISMYKACWIESENKNMLREFKLRKAQKMATDKQGRDVFMADSQFILQMAQQEFRTLNFTSLLNFSTIVLRCTSKASYKL